MKESEAIAKQHRLPEKTPPPPINMPPVITPSMTSQQVHDVLSKIDELKDEIGWVLQEGVNGKHYQKLTNEVLAGFGVSTWGKRCAFLDLQLRNVPLKEVSQADIQDYCGQAWGVKQRPAVVKPTWSEDKDEAFAMEMKQRTADRQRAVKERLEKQTEKDKEKLSKTQNLQIHEIKKKGNGKTVLLAR
jgi:hypothetical protein